MENKQQVINALNDLLTRNHEADKGYSFAGNSVSDVPLRKWLFANSGMRERFEDQLIMEIKKLDGTPDPSSSFLGSLHRAWLDFKSEITEDNISYVLEECKRGEERSLEDYERVLEEVDLPPQIQMVLREHHKNIQESLANLKALIPAYEQQQNS